MKPVVRAESWQFAGASLVSVVVGNVGVGHVGVGHVDFVESETYNELISRLPRSFPEKKIITFGPAVLPRNYVLNIWVGADIGVYTMNPMLPLLWASCSTFSK